MGTLVPCANCGDRFERMQNTRYCSTACRFIHKFTISLNGCWTWDSSLSPDGYGQIRIESSLPRAHRVAYEMWVGPIPDGLQLDHLCRNRACLRPDHLEPVTARENTLRGESPAVRLRRVGLCKRGHEMDAGNRYIDPKGKTRCRPCAAAYMRERGRALRASTQEANRLREQT